MKERDLGISAEDLELRVAWAISTPLGLFILDKIAQSEDGVHVSDLAKNLEAPDGWMSLARLMRADLIEEGGHPST